MKIQLSNVQPNPFRNIERYPIDRIKVEALKATILRTGFWDNIVARPRLVPGNATGMKRALGAQISHGHHRLVALNELYPPTHEIGLIIRDFDDAQMLHAMADENMDEWKHSGAVAVETVRAVRDFLVSGARPVRQGSNGTKPSGITEITAFLGWPAGRIERALSIIHAEEKGDLEPEDTAGLDLRSADELRTSVARITEPEVKREVIKRTREKIDAGKIGYRGIRDVVTEVRNEIAATQIRPLIPANVASQLWHDIDAYWRSKLEIGDQRIARAEILRLIAENRNTEELTRSVRPWADQLADALRAMATEATRLADLLEAKQAVETGA